MYRCLASSSTSLRRYRRVVLTLTIALIGSAAPVAAQSLGWVLDTSPATATQPYRPIRLLAVNVATGIEVARFDPPAGVQFGWNGVVTPDGRYYLLATSAGIARFRTTPASFDRIVGPAVPVESLVVSPAGRDLHAFGPQGHAVVDWETGTVLSTECCRNPGIAFTPDGTVRIEHRLRLRSTDQVRTIAAYREATGELLWENEIYLYYSCSGMAATNSYVAFFCTDWETTEIIVWDIASGTQNSGFQNIWAPYLAWHGDRLLLSMEDFLSSALRLSSYDPRTGQLTIIAERPGPPLSMTASVVVSPDNRHAYWQTNHHPPRVGIDSTLYDVIDLASDTVVGTGRLPGFQFGLAISAALACHFNLPATVAAPIEGGMVGIPVVPDPACTGWSVPDQPSVLNPGPHIGPVTLLVQTWANAEASEKTTPLRIGVQTVLITQPSGVPAAPALEAAVAGDRVALSWTPSIGAGITAFIVRGAIAGGAVTDVLQLPASLRGWTSPPLPPGSYEVELVAANGAGRSAASTRRTFSIGAAGTPEPPSGLIASVADDRVALSWTPASTSPAPSGFVVEAAANGSPAFAPVARTEVPSLVATRVPAGTWDVRVRSATASGVSEPSAAISVTTAPCTAAPAPPQEPWALWTPPAVSVRWSPPTTGAVEEYVIEVGSASGRADLGQLIVPSTRVTHTEQVSPLVAFVRVRARNVCGLSAPSAEIPIVVY